MYFFSTRARYLMADTRQVFPRLKVAASSNTMLFIPSYFNFVRVRNYFQSTNVPFVSCCECVLVPHAHREPLTALSGTPRHLTLLAREANSFTDACRFLCAPSDSTSIEGTVLLVSSVRSVLLMTARFRIRGIGSVVFYSIPQYGNFYSEILNMVGSDEAGSVIVMFSKFDALPMERLLGRKSARRCLKGSKSSYLFM